MENKMVLTRIEKGRKTLDLYIGIYENNCVLVDPNTWKLHQKRIAKRIRQEERKTRRAAKQAAELAISAPVYWWWCLKDKTPGVRLL